MEATMNDATTTLPADPRTLNCPSWCQTDHAEEWTTAVDLDAEAAQMLAEYPEHYLKVLGLGLRGDQGRPVPPIWCPPSHRRALGAVTVRVGDGTRTDQLEVERERYDGDLPGAVDVVRVDPPTGWTEDYTATEARGLAALLLDGAGAIEGSDSSSRVVDLSGLTAGQQGLAFAIRDALRSGEAPDVEDYTAATAQDLDAVERVLGAAMVHHGAGATRTVNLGQVLEMLDGGEQNAPDALRGYRVTALLWSLLTQQVLPAQVWPLLHDGDVPTLDRLIFADEPIEGSSDTAADRRSRG